MNEHVLDGVLAHMGSFLGLATLGAARGRPASDPLRSRLALVASALLAASVLLHLASASVAYTGELGLAGMAAVLGRTTFGRSLAVHALGAAGALLLLRRPPASRAASGVALVGLVWLGHGGAQGEVSARMGLTLLHVGALLAWISGLFAVFADLATGVRAADAVRVFSRRALPLVAVGIVAGVLLTGAYVGRGVAADGVPWLASLGAKGLAVAGALVAALRNRRCLARLDAADGWPALERGLVLEVFGVLTAVGLAGLLSQLPSP